MKYYEQLESLGVIVKLEKSGDLSGFAYAGTSGYVPYDMLVIQSKFPNVVIDFKILGTDNKHKILHSEIEFLVIQNTLAITIDGTRYSTNGSNIYTILQNWLTQYAPRLFELNIVVEYVDTNRFRFSTLLTSTELVYQIYVGRNAVIGETLYNVTDYRPGNPGVILAGNEIVDPTGGFEANNFATGMLVTITGSKWPLNNQRYNILYVDPAQLVLSYQGPFWNESDVFGDVNDRWNNLYDFSWEAFQDPNINFTFETIGYDTNNGAVVQFTDTSTIPSPVTWIWDYGDGVMYSSNISNFINNVDNPYKPNHTYKSAGKYVVQLTIIDSAAIVHSNTELITALPNHASTNGVAYVNGLVLHTHEFLRYPRENYGSSPNVAYTWSWLDSYPTNANGTDQIFYYDFSGSQLALQNAGIYTYVGTVPLITDPLTNTKIFLNDKPNADLDFVKDASKQQTVFETLTYQLQHVDSSTDVSFEPEPMQIFVGYRSDLEGVNNRTVILNKLEEITLQITTSKKDATNVQTHLPVNLYKNVVYIFPDIAELRVESFTTNFIDLDFKPGQSIMINATDNTNQFGQAPFLNNGKIVQISQVGTNWMRFVDASSLVAEVSWKETVNYRSPYDTISTSFTVTLAVQPVEIARITLTGQTEIEDGRYKVLTTNNGYNVKPKDTFIFKEYDVEEAGIDWVFLNAKRKELLVNAPEIYNFIGSYKAIINSINFFGYNDLIFNEYYRNIDKTSKQFGQLFKVEISDIFNNQVIGFQAKDSIIGLTPNPKYNKTNLFNLTYQITDYQGNSVLAYTLDEVIIKLLGLKGWLMDEVIPIGKRILDITGQTQNVAPITIKHDLKQVFSIDVTDNLAPVNFKIEAYLQPIINNSKTYNVHLSFYTEDNSVPPYFEIKIQTFSTDDDFRKQPFTMRPVQIIREFKTDMKSYNFAADINVDPFIAVEVTTFNGYSEIFTKKRTYSLQSLAFL